MEVSSRWTESCPDQSTNVLIIWESLQCFSGFVVFLCPILKWTLTVIPLLSKCEPSWMSDLFHLQSTAFQSSPSHLAAPSAVKNCSDWSVSQTETGEKREVVGRVVTIGKAVDFLQFWLANQWQPAQQTEALPSRKCDEIFKRGSWDEGIMEGKRKGNLLNLFKLFSTAGCVCACVCVYQGCTGCNPLSWPCASDK